MNVNSSIEDLNLWIGNQEVVEDFIFSRKVDAMSALVDENKKYHNGEELPYCWHWIFFNPIYSNQDTGIDGHRKKGGFLPPIMLPRRMWAGSRLKFISPLIIGDKITKISTIDNITFKESKSNGKLCFVTVKHHIYGDSGGEIIEEQDIVYKEDISPSNENIVSNCVNYKTVWADTIEPNSVLLFKYSALSYNGHRIHYDRDYAVNIEKYPGLVVHGPLIATFIMNSFIHHEHSKVLSFEFKNKNPIFDGNNYKIILSKSNDLNIKEMFAIGSNDEVAVEAKIYI